MVDQKNLRLTRSFKKKCLLVVTWNANNLSKQVVPITYIEGNTGILFGADKEEPSKPKAGKAS